MENCSAPGFTCRDPLAQIDPEVPVDQTNDSASGRPSAEYLDRDAEEKRIAAEISGIAPPHASFLKMPHHDCCAGVDVPGVGHVHAHGCAAVEHHNRAVGHSYQPGHVPDPLREYVTIGDDVFAAGHAALGGLTRAIDSMQQRITEREWLFIQLLFASRALAQSALTTRLAEWGWVMCKECGWRVGGYAAAGHRPQCQVGRVLDVVAKILALSNVNPTGKENATDGGAGCAGDGIRLRSTEEHVCRECGRSDGNWDRLLWPKILPFPTEKLSERQCSQLDPDGIRWLFTHHCEKSHNVDPGKSLGAQPGHGVDALFAEKGGPA